MDKGNIGIGVFAVGIIALLTFFGGARTQELSGASFVETHQKTPGAVLLDVRTPWEFATGHLEGALNVDFENPTFTSEVQKLDKTKPYFLYCRSGNRSGQAIAIMKKEGFKNITELEGGIVSNQGALHLITATPATESGTAAYTTP
jgi:rhodanese-related sulfurtransferase